MFRGELPHYRLAQLVGGERGRAFMAASRAWSDGEGVVDWDRGVAGYAPVAPTALDAADETEPAEAAS